MRKKINIAIDGYSSCGKSTLAKALAGQLNYVYIDTGAMYRAIALYCMSNNIINGNIDIEKLIELLPTIEVSFKYNNTTNLAETYLNGENVEQKIRGVEVSNRVSEIAKIKQVRVKLVDMQRKLGEKKGIVMDGRDIGTVVFPNAELKFFVTADKKIRAKRRYDELKSKGDDVTIEQVMLNIAKRDFEDVNRQENPLKQAKDAIVIDNTELSRDEQLAIALKYANQRID